MLQADEMVNIAVEKINSLLELFIGINDSELGTQFCKINMQKNIKYTEKIKN